MVLKNWAAIVMGAIVSGSSLFAQQVPDSPNYAWRASAQTANRPIYQPRSSQHIISSPQQDRFASASASGLASRPSVRTRQEDDPALIDRQASPSDRATAPRTTLQSPQPTLAVPAQDSPKIDAQPLLPNQVTPPLPPGASDFKNRPGLSVADMPEPSSCPPESNWCKLGCERKLFGSTPNGFGIGGWSQFGVHNEDSLGFNDRQDELNLHQQWFYVEKRPRCNHGWGYRTDVLYGIDAQNTQAFGNPPTGAPSGWDNDWDYGSFGWALPQAYVDYQDCFWNVKIGKFFSPFGYESIASPNNFFYSRSYARNFIEPFTMSGILGERQLSEQRSLIMGATTGWDTGFDQNSSGFNLIAGMRSKFGDNASLASTVSLANTGYRGEGYLNSQVLQVDLSKQTKYVLQGDVLNLGTNQEFAIVNYLFHEFNPCLKVGTRLEWWKSDQIFPDTKSTWGWTNGINFRPHANFVIRPETRVDWGAGAPNPGKIILGIDGILTF